MLVLRTREGGLRACQYWCLLCAEAIWEVGGLTPRPMGGGAGGWEVVVVVGGGGGWWWVAVGGGWWWWVLCSVGALDGGVPMSRVDFKKQ